MSQTYGITSTMGPSYTNQTGSILFTGYTYVYSANTLTVKPTVVNGIDCYLTVTANPSAVPITIGNHIAGPNIPSGTVVQESLGSGIYRVSRSQTQGNTAVSAYVCIGTPIQYGQVVATASTYSADGYAGRLDFYAPSYTYKTQSILTLTDGNCFVTGNLYVNGAQFAPTGGNWSVTNGNTWLTTGSLGVLTSTPTYAIDVSGSGRFSGYCYSAGFVTTSDYRVKHDVHDLAADKTVDLLRPVEYDLEEMGGQPGHHDMGFIAHEVQNAYPFLVSGEKDGDNYQALNYTGIIAILVKEVQQLKAELRTIRTSLDERR